MPSEKDQDFKAVQATACWGIENYNLKEVLAQERVQYQQSLTVNFDTGTCKKKALFFSAAAELELY